MVLKTEGYANNLKFLNIRGYLNSSEIIESDIYASYFYSSEVSIFNLRQSKFKDRHNVKEHLILLSLNDISQSFLVRL